MRRPLEAAHHFSRLPTVGALHQPGRRARTGHHELSRGQQLHPVSERQRPFDVDQYDADVWKPDLEQVAGEGVDDEQVAVWVVNDAV
ncbi:unnamed protein product [Linum trigynum]|uniref:Uncharacterized protein n=1 Tax=Linum trigynum TaxID=586398 RepID=A0AAV2CPV4_9ROSI